jgi:hypothetical protein
MRKYLSIATLLILSLVAALAGLHTPAVRAQSGANTLVQTSLTADISSSANFIQVASATGITTAQNTTNTLLYVDGEEMVVVGVNGLQIHVTRGAGGTEAFGHRNKAMVLAGNPTWFFNHDPLPYSGCSQTTGIPLSTPYVNVISSHQWLCSTITKTWVPGFQNTDFSPAVTTAVASVAGTTTPSGPLFHITGTNAITAWGIPVGMNATAVGGTSFCVIPDGTFTTTATNNIALASTAVVNKLICWTWDATNSKFVPTY